jgi:hypothetical protein
MAEFKFDNDKIKTILSKRAQSILLSTEEENYSRKLFDAMMDSKKTVQKTVRIVTGTELRKEKESDLKKQMQTPTRVEAVRPISDTKATPTHDNDAQPDESLRGGEKLPDVDEKGKTVTTEEQALSDKIQIDVSNPTNAPQALPVTTEPAAKFVAVDPVKIGDQVVKNFARTGQQIVKGVVLNVVNDRAVVKWANGLQTHEIAYLLVKCHIEEARPLAVNQTTDIPVKKGSPSHTEVYEAVKDKPGVEDPHALANYIVHEQGGDEKVKKDGDILPTPAQSMPMMPTPFQDLLSSLERVVGLAGDMKAMQARHSVDPEIADSYGQIVDSMRQIAETILSALSLELSEANEQE